MGKKVEVQEVVESVESNVVQHLDVDANDPRLFPVVDGNTQPKVDINKPL